MTKNNQVNEECIIEGCGKSGGLYVTHEGYKTGPYCSQHRFELQCHIDRRKRQMINSEWNSWIDEFQFDISQKDNKDTRTSAWDVAYGKSKGSE